MVEVEVVDGLHSLARMPRARPNASSTSRSPSIPPPPTGVPSAPAPPSAKRLKRRPLSPLLSATAASTAFAKRLAVEVEEGEGSQEAKGRMRWSVEER